MLDAAEVESLLSKLCIDLGFCLPPEDENRLCAEPPGDVDAFTDAVFLAEGLNPQYADRHLYRRVREVVSGAYEKHYEPSEA